jgi:hypothetical protein
MKKLNRSIKKSYGSMLDKGKLLSEQKLGKIFGGHASSTLKKSESSSC